MLRSFGGLSGSFLRVTVTPDLLFFPLPGIVDEVEDVVERENNKDHVKKFN